MGVLGDLLKLKKVQQLAAREVTRWWILSLLTKRFSSLSSKIVNGVYSIDDNTALEELLLEIIDFQNLEEVITKLNPFLKSYPNLRSEKPVIMITQDRYQYQLYHLDEQQYSCLNEQSFCIKEDAPHIWDIENYLERQRKDLNLAQLNITLSEITGGSCQLYDDWKGSFCFPFALSISYQEKVLNNYLIILSDWRGHLEFRLKRLIADEEREHYSGIERHVIREPFKDEFSRTEINEFIRCLLTYLVGYFQGIKDKSHPVFFKHIDSNSILYGYNGKDYWEKHYEDSDEYHRELEQLKQQSLKENYEEKS